MHRNRIAVLALAALLAVPMTTASAEPVFFDAEIRPLGAPSPDLERAFAALLESENGPAWAAYTVPMVDGRRNLCCGGPSLCSLEGSGDCRLNRREAGAGGQLRVLLRIHERRVTEIRAFSSDCRLDAGGLPVHV